MEAKSVYAKHLDTEEVREFESLSEAGRQIGLKFPVLAKQIYKKRIFKNEWIMAFDLNEIKDINRKSFTKPIYVYDLAKNKVVKEYLSFKELGEKYGYSEQRVRNSVYRATIVDRKYGFSYENNLTEKYKETLKVMKSTGLLQNKTKTKFTIIDFETGLQTTKTCYLVDLAKNLDVNYHFLCTKKNKRELVRNRYAIATNRQDIKYFEDMRIKKYAKKKTAKKKAPKIDLNVNGELVYKEPNRPVKRIGKLGTEEIKNRFKK